jgi:hypothetical protein
MDYTVALMVYLVSIIGVFYSMWAMTVFKDDKLMVGVTSLTAVVFCATTYIGGMMVQAVS